MDNIFSLFTKDAQQVLANAKASAKKYKHEHITANHLLWGLLDIPGSQGEAALAEFRFNLDNLKARTEAYIKLNGQDNPGDVAPGFADRRYRLSADATAIIRAANAEAEAQNVNFVDTRLLLMGMLGQPQSSAGQLLNQYGITLDSFREKVDLSAAPPVDTTPPKREKGSARRIPLGISPIFIGLVLFTAVAGYLTYAEIGNPNVAVFMFVIGGWIISVALHEFGHALVAYLGGDTTVAEKGYLTLNPLKYVHPVLSVVLPIAFLLMGGIPLMGGAVYINHHFIRSRFMRSLTSAAGPIATLICAILCAIPFFFEAAYFSFERHSTFWAGLGVLCFFQLFALLLNLLPAPGLDGFGILEPFIPDDILRQVSIIRQFSMIILFMLFIYTPFGQKISEAIWNTLIFFNAAIAYFAYQGFELFRFWS